MSVVQHLKDMISSNASERSEEWAEKWFAAPRQRVAAGAVRSILSVAGGDLDRLTPATRFTEDLALNELQRVQIVLAIEQQFHLEISDAAAASMDTIGELVEWIYMETETLAVKPADRK